MKTTLFLLLAALPAWAAAQSFQTLPENSDTLDQLNSLHACSYHQLLPKQTMHHLSPDKLGPVIGVSVDRMEGKVFKLGKYFRPKDTVVFYADDEAYNVAASTNKSGLERARADSGVLLTQYQRGTELLRYCRDRLQAVEDQVKVLGEGGALQPWTAE